MHPKKRQLLKTLDQLREQIESLPLEESRETTWSPPSRGQFLREYIKRHNRLKPDHHDFRIRAYRQTVDHFTGGMETLAVQLGQELSLVHTSEQYLPAAVDRVHMAAKRLDADDGPEII